MQTWTNQLWEKRDQICPAGVRRGSSRTAWRCWKRPVWADTGSKTSVSGCPPSPPLSVNGQSKILSSTESYGNIVQSPDIDTSKVLICWNKIGVIFQGWCMRGSPDGYAPFLEWLSLVFLVCGLLRPLCQSYNFTMLLLFETITTILESWDEERYLLLDISKAD